MTIIDTTKWLLSTSAVAMLVGCGGGGDAGPGPLKHTLDDMFIARVPIDQKQKVVTSQNQFQIARMEHAKAQADLDEARVQVGVGKNELEVARLGEKSAREQHKAAEKSGDMNRVNRTARMIRGAELTRRAADQRVAYLRARVGYLKVNLRYSKEDMYHKEARYELSKAKVARDKDIRPKGFAYETYDKQAIERSRRVQQWRAKLNAEKVKLDGERKKWRSLDRQAKAANGEAPAKGGGKASKPAGAGAKGAKDDAKGAGGDRNRGGSGDGGRDGADKP